MNNLSLLLINLILSFVQNYEIPISITKVGFEYSSIKAISPTSVYLTKPNNDIIFDFSIPNTYKESVESIPYNAPNLPLIFKDDNDNIQIFHFFGDSLRFVSNKSRPDDTSLKHKVIYSFRAFYDCAYLKDDSGHYAYYSYISVSDSINLRKFGITKLGDLDFEISGDYKNCLYGITITEDFFGKEGALFIEYCYEQQSNLVL